MRDWINVYFMITLSLSARLQEGFFVLKIGSEASIKARQILLEVKKMIHLTDVNKRFGKDQAVFCGRRCIA